MKKLLFIALILALILSLAGCKRQTAAEKAWEQMKDIQITADQKTVQEVEQGKGK